MAEFESPFVPPKETKKRNEYIGTGLEWRRVELSMLAELHGTPNPYELIDSKGQKIATVYYSGPPKYSHGPISTGPAEWSFETEPSPNLPYAKQEGFPSQESAQRACVEFVVEKYQYDES